MEFYDKREPRQLERTEAAIDYACADLVAGRDEMYGKHLDEFVQAVHDEAFPAVIHAMEVAPDRIVDAIDALRRIYNIADLAAVDDNWFSNAPIMFDDNVKPAIKEYYSIVEGSTNGNQDN